MEFHYDTSMDYLARGSIGYGDTYTQWGMTTKLCPDMAKVTAKRGQDLAGFARHIGLRRVRFLERR